MCQNGGVFGCRSVGLYSPCSVQTYQGIDRCGERLAQEVGAYVRQHPALQRISVVGHSMGGLIARYALGKSPDPCIPSRASGAYVAGRTPALQDHEQHRTGFCQVY